MHINYRVLIILIEVFFIMKNVNFESWFKWHNVSVHKIERFCELRKCSDEDFIKCDSMLCAINHAISDIYTYFKNQVDSRAELCFLVRNIDFIISCIKDINNILFATGTSNNEIVYGKCFVDSKVISKFRFFRSLILAHPITKYTNDIKLFGLELNNKDKQSILYLEDIICGNIILHDNDNYKYKLRLCRKDSSQPIFVNLDFDEYITDVINVIIKSVKDLCKKLYRKIKVKEVELRNCRLNIDNTNMLTYINSLHKELRVRYPSYIREEHINYFDVSDNLSELQPFNYSENDLCKNIVYNSVIKDCLIFFSVKFSDATQIKYDVFLEYLKKELKRIEHDLQTMHYDENKDYFSYLYCYMRGLINGDIIHRDLQVLQYGDRFPFIGSFDYFKLSDAESCLYHIIGEIEKYIHLDKSVNDKGLYCQYMAAVYLSNLEKRGNRQ